MKNNTREEEKMSLTSHLEELKTRLIRVLIVVGSGFGVCYMFKEWSFRVITKPLVDVMPAQSSLIFTGLPEAFFIHMKIAFFASLLITAPYTGTRKNTFSPLSSSLRSCSAAGSCSAISSPCLRHSLFL
jgi:Sec-independent protein secretion pathway component TatC